MAHERAQRQGGRSRSDVVVWIVMGLLVASTTTVLYDLYVLLSALTGGM